MKDEMRDGVTLRDGRCPTGITGLDEVLVDGLPSNCFYLIQGDPGSGKTTLALQYLLEGVRRGERLSTSHSLKRRRSCSKSPVPMGGRLTPFHCLSCRH